MVQAMPLFGGLGGLGGWGWVEAETEGMGWFGGEGVRWRLDAWEGKARLRRRLEWDPFPLHHPPAPPPGLTNCGGGGGGGGGGGSGDGKQGVSGVAACKAERSGLVGDAAVEELLRSAVSLSRSASAHAEGAADVRHTEEHGGGQGDDDEGDGGEEGEGTAGASDDGAGWSPRLEEDLEAISDFWSALQHKRAGQQPGAFLASLLSAPDVHPALVQCFVESGEWDPAEGRFLEDPDLPGRIPALQALAQRGIGAQQQQQQQQRAEAEEEEEKEAPVCLASESPTSSNATDTQADSVPYPSAHLERRKRAGSVLAVHLMGTSPFQASRDKDKHGGGAEVACELITPMAKCRGTLVIAQRALRFVPDQDAAAVEEADTIHRTLPETVWLNAVRGRTHEWAVSEVVAIRGRQHALLQTALEVFFAHAPPALFNFPEDEQHFDPNKTVARAVFHRLQAAARGSNGLLRDRLKSYPDLPHVREVEAVQEQWIERRISTLEYLMHLDTLAGRTYNDLSQYPVFPWVLRDYLSASIDLSDPASFRDLSKPIGAQTAEQRAERVQLFNQGMSGPKPSHYQPCKHYSQPMAICDLLVRVEPFTSMRVAWQGGNFDCADRIFNDLGKHFDLAQTVSFMELTPELFVLPEVLLNTAGHDFGAKQDGSRVNHVVLPPWALGSAHRFVRLHRQALESEYVSANLHRWIDLIFGFQQRSPHAEEAFNSYETWFYSNEAVFDNPKARETMLNLGQMPLRLFSSLHPPRKPLLHAALPVWEKTVHPERPRLVSSQLSSVFKFQGSSAVLAASWVSDGLVVSVDSAGFLRQWGWQPRSDAVQQEWNLLRRLSSCSCSSSASQTLPAAHLPAATESSPSTPPLKELATVQLPGVSLTSSAVTACAGASQKQWLLLLGGADGSVQVLQGVEPSRQRWRPHSCRVVCIAVVQQPGLGPAVLTGGEDGTVRVWRLQVMASGRKLQGSVGCEATLCCHTEGVACMSASVSLSLLLSGSDDHTCSLCRITPDRYAHLRSLVLPPPPAGSTGGVSLVALSDDGEVVAYSAAWGCLFFSDANGAPFTTTDGAPFDPRTAFANPRPPLTAMALSSSGQCLVTGSNEGQVMVWEMASRTLVQRIRLSGSAAVQTLSFSPCSDYLLAGLADGDIHLVTSQTELARRRQRIRPTEAA